MLRCEERETLQDRKDKHAEMMNRFGNLINNYSSQNSLSDIQDKTSMLDILRTIFLLLSDNNAALRQLKIKKEECLETLKKCGGEDSRKTKYKDAICSVYGTIVQLRNLISESSRLLDLACEKPAFFHGKLKASTGLVLQVSCRKTCPTVYPPPPNPTGNEIAHSSPFLQQQSNEWFEFKKSHPHPVSGSSLYEINGFETLKQKQQRYNKYHKGITCPPASSEVQYALDHGTANKVNAIATICTKIVPVLFPIVLFSEIGSVTLNHLKTNHVHVNEGKCTTDNESHSFALASPDGVLVD